MGQARTNRKSVSRRQFIKGAAAVVASGPFVLGLDKKALKPNLLFLLTDQQRADTMAAYGNRNIHAPNLNKLAEESIVFRRAYVSQPVCTPSRSTILTGFWPHTTGLTENNVALPKEVPTFPELLHDCDYRTAYMGKWHLGDEIFAQHGFKEWQSIEDGYCRFYGEERDISTRSSYDRFLRSLGYKSDGPRFSRDYASRLPLEHCKPRFLERQACDFLRRHRKEPFILYVSFLEPHSPFFGPLNDEHKPSEIMLPNNFDDPPDDKEPENYRLRYRKYLKNGFKGDPLVTEADWRHLIAKYWGLVTQVDRSIGGILKTLEQLGLADNTLVVFTSDHGDMMGSHRLVTKSVMYEEAMRVAWLMRIPAFGRKHRVITSPVSHIDLVPTMLDLMGRRDKTVTERFPGKSLVPLVRGKACPEGYVYIEWNAGDGLCAGRNPRGRLRKPEGRRGINSRAVVSPDGWKLCLHDRDRNQLFNLGRDPAEITNLYALPEYGEIIDTLTARVRSWQEQAHDTIQVGA